MGKKEERDDIKKGGGIETIYWELIVELCLYQLEQLHGESTADSYKFKFNTKNGKTHYYKISLKAGKTIVEWGCSTKNHGVLSKAWNLDLTHMPAIGSHIIRDIEDITGEKYE